MPRQGPEEHDSVASGPAKCGHVLGADDDRTVARYAPPLAHGTVGGVVKRDQAAGRRPPERFVALARSGAESRYHGPVVGYGRRNAMVMERLNRKNAETDRS